MSTLCIHQVHLPHNNLERSSSYDSTVSSLSSLFDNTMYINNNNNSDNYNNDHNNDNTKSCHFTVAIDSLSSSFPETSQVLYSQHVQSSGGQVNVQIIQTLGTLICKNTDCHPQHIINNHCVVLKHISIINNDRNLRYMSAVHNELKVHTKIQQAMEKTSCNHDHYHFLKLYGNFEKNNSKRMHTYLVLENCEKGDLLNYLITAPSTGVVLPSLPQIRLWFKQLVQGMNILHNQLNIIHGDISLENLLLDDQMNVKICDFGLARQIPVPPNQMKTSHMCSFVVGKVPYMSPEVLSLDSQRGRNEVFLGVKCMSYDPYAADVWTCGSVLFATLMMFQIDPRIINHIFTTQDGGVDSEDNSGIPYHSTFFNNDKNEPYIKSARRLAHVCTYYNTKNKNPELQRPVLEFEQAGGFDLLSHIFCPPQNRWTIEQLMKHPFVAHS